MAVVTAGYLIDKSALARMRVDAVRRRVVPLIEARVAATCAIVDLEVLFSARNVQDFEEIRARRALAYRTVELEEATFRRAIEVQGVLARKGRHRVSIPDLIIAAAAEMVGLTVLHYDADYDTIAEVTGQPVEWVVPRGSV